MDIQKEYILRLRLKRLVSKYMKHEKKYTKLINELNNEVMKISLSIEAKLAIRNSW